MMIDWERVREVQEQVGEAEFHTMLKLTFDEIELICARLALDGPREMEADFRFLKDRARANGFGQFAHLCESSEGLVTSGRWTEVRLGHLLDCYAVSKSALAQGVADRAKPRSGIPRGCGHG